MEPRRDGVAALQATALGRDLCSHVSYGRGVPLAVAIAVLAFLRAAAKPKALEVLFAADAGDREPMRTYPHAVSDALRTALRGIDDGLKRIRADRAGRSGYDYPFRQRDL